MSVVDLLFIPSILHGNDDIVRKAGELDGAWDFFYIGNKN